MTQGNDALEIPQMFNGPEIEVIRHRSGLAVEIRSDETYFYVRENNGEGAVVGTIRRPRRYGNGMWTVATIDGETVMHRNQPDCIGPRTCLIALAREIAKRKEA